MASSRDPARTTRGELLLLVAGFAAVGAAAALVARALTELPFAGYDDAGIFFVYARNLLDGHGLVYNPGGERVEGFTSPAWLLACTAAMALADRFEPLLVATCVLVVAASAAALASLVRDALVRLGGLSAGAALATGASVVGLVLIQPGFVTWNGLSLMDSALWTGALMGCATCVLRGALGEAEAARTRRPFLLLLVLLAFVRPESMAWGPFLIASSAAIAVASGRSVRAAVRQHAPHAAAFALAHLLQIAFRMAYFGFPLPNTYYAKVSQDHGSRLGAGLLYLLDFLTFNPAYGMALLLAPIALVVAAGRRRSPTPAGDPLVRAQACAFALLLAGAAVPVLEGEDHFGLSRMYQPVMPLVAVQAALAACALLRVGRRAVAASSAAAAVLAVTLALVAGLSTWPILALFVGETRLPGRTREPIGPRWEILMQHDLRAMGEELSDLFAPDPPSVAVVAAGGFALGYDGPVFDLLGLNDVEMAHSPGPRVGMPGHAAFDADVFFRRAPDVVVLALWSPARNHRGVPRTMICGVFDSPPELEVGYPHLRADSIVNFDEVVLKGLLRDPRFRREYPWASVRPPGRNRWVHAPFRRGFLADLSRRGFEIRVETFGPEDRG